MIDTAPSTIGRKSEDCLGFNWRTADGEVLCQSCGSMERHPAEYQRLNGVPYCRICADRPQWHLKGNTMTDETATDETTTDDSFDTTDASGETVTVAPEGEKPAKRTRATKTTGGKNGKATGGKGSKKPATTTPPAAPVTGDKPARFKGSMEHARRMRAMSADGRSVKEIAAETGASPDLVRNILKGKFYKED